MNNVRRASRPRGLRIIERSTLNAYCYGYISAEQLKSLMENARLTRHRKYNNYIRWFRRHKRYGKISSHLSA